MAFIDRVDRYYDKMKSEIQLDLTKSYTSKFYKDSNNKHTVELLSKDGTVFKAHYDTVGVYNLANSVWYWGWNIDLIDKKLVHKSIKKFPQYIKDNYKEFTKEQAEDYSFRTSTGNFITTPKRVTDLVKLALYLQKGVWHLAVCRGVDGSARVCNKDSQNSVSLEYIIIKRVLQKK